MIEKKGLKLTIALLKKLYLEYLKVPSWDLKSSMLLLVIFSFILDNMETLSYAYDNTTYCSYNTFEDVILCYAYDNTTYCSYNTFEDVTLCLERTADNLF